jgi:hypothetical protein
MLKRQRAWLGSSRAERVVVVVLGVDTIVVMLGALFEYFRLMR